METNIQKWGNSLGVRIPKNILTESSLREGSRVVVLATRTGIAIEVAKKRPKVLADLLKGIKSTNLHQEVMWGEARGKEIW